MNYTCAFEEIDLMMMIPGTTFLVKSVYVFFAFSVDRNQFHSMICWCRSNYVVKVSLELFLLPLVHVFCTSKEIKVKSELKVNYLKEVRKKIQRTEIQRNIKLEAEYKYKYVVKV